MMKSFKIFNSFLAIAAACLSLAGSARAALTQMELTYDTAYIGNINLAGVESAYGIPLTAFQATYKSGDPLPYPATSPFYTFCCDIAPTMYSPGWWQSQALPTLGNQNGNIVPYINGGIQRAAGIYNAFIGRVDTSTSSGQLYGAALQLAIWNDLYDGDNSASAGAFSVSGWNSAPALALAGQILTSGANAKIDPTLISTFWNATDSSGKSAYNQDLIGPGSGEILTGSAVATVSAPEPGTFAAGAFACAYLGIWGIRRHRRHR